jgi:hypothetical protein
MDVKCRLSCDRCRALGIAPLTSVFIYGQNSDRFQDGISLGSARLGQSAHPCAQRGEGLAAIDLYPYECDPMVIALDGAAVRQAAREQEIAAAVLSR